MHGNNGPPYVCRVINKQHMADLKETEKPITLRQKLALQLIMMAMAILNPFEYTHQFKEWREDFTKRLNGEV